MAKKAKGKDARSASGCCASGCCDSDCACQGASALDCCQVEAVVSLDHRGQMVLPKDVRERAGFGPEQKLAVVSWKSGDTVCCITLQKADDLADAIRQSYGPLLSLAARKE